MSQPNKEEKEFDIHYLNALIANRKAFYEILSMQKGYYLPAFESKAITNDYLLGVAKGEYFAIKRDAQKTPYFQKRITKQELYEEIHKKLDGKLLGFDIFSLPEKVWLVNVLFTIDPGNSLFKDAAEILTRQMPKK